VAQLLRPAADGDHVVARPPLADVLAVTLEFGDEEREVAVMAVPGGGQPETPEHGPGLLLPVDIDLAGPVGGEHPAHQVPLPGGQRLPVVEQFPGRGVGDQHIPATPLDQRRERVEALHEIDHPRVDPLGRRGHRRAATGCAAAGRVVAAVGEHLQVALLSGGHPQRGRQGVQNLRRRPHRASLLQKGVVGGGHVSQQRDLLAAQAGGAPATARRQPDVGRGQPVTARPQQLPQRLRVSDNRHATQPTHASTSKSPLWLLLSRSRRLVA